MSRLATVTLSIALGLVLGAGVGVARADGPGAAYAGEEIGTIRFLDRALNLVVLAGGDEFYATDQRMLSNLTVGELVKVDFTHDSYLNHHHRDERWGTARTAMPQMPQDH